MNEIDELLREFRSTFDEPPPGAMERARSRAVGGVGERTVRLRARWLAMPATAVGVSAAAVSASLMLGHAPAIVAESTAQPAAPVSSTPAPPTTAELIEAWARDLETGPTPPPAAPGQLIDVGLRVLQGAGWQDQHMTVARQGLLLLSNTDHDNLASFQQYVAEQQTAFAQVGPSWRYPTAEWLEALETTPAGLRHACGDLCHDDWSTWNAVSEGLLVRGELMLPAQVRAGLVRLLGTLDGVTAYEATVDGRLVRVISVPRTFEPRPGLTLSYDRAELYIDPSLDRFVGSGTLQTAGPPDLPQCVTDGGPSHPVVPRPTGDECFEVIALDEPERVGITLWEQTLVAP